MKNRRDISPISEALHSVLRASNLDHKIKEHELLDRWADIAGSALANYTEPISFERGILVLRVSNAIWRQELALRKQELISSMNTKLGMQLVKDIILR